MIVDVGDPILSNVSQMGLPIKFSETPGHIRSPRHISGEDTDKIINEFNLNGDFDLTDIENKKIVENIMEPPLNGIKVIESTNVIAGAGIDVYEKEPLPSDHKLRFVPNALLLPHIGYVTAENYSKFYYLL